MSRSAVNWIIIAAAIFLACINPINAHYKLHRPILTLGLDLKGGVEVLLRAVPEQGREVMDDEINGAMEVVGNRIDPSGTKEIFISKVGADRILVQVPGEKNPDSIISVLGDTALLEFLNTAQESLAEGTDLNIEGTKERKPEYAKYETIVTGADLNKAYVTFPQGKPTIAFEFKPEAAETFGQFTNNHVGQYLTVILDGKVLTSPVIQSPIWGGSGVIEGRFTVDEASKVVRQLNAGALPVPLEILSSSVVGPTLGQESIDKSYIAGLVGLGAVILFMLVFYRLPGLVSVVALALYVVLTLGFMSLFNITLTLPGIAGFLLSIGMAIDANIIIFERLKEEIRWGKTLLAALDAAFERGWAAILDGNLTTILAAVVLYLLGTGPVKGFGVALIIGNLMALFTGVFIVRNLLEVVVKGVKTVNLYSPVYKELSIPAVQLREGQYFRFIERTPIWVAVSGAVALAGIIFMVMNSQSKLEFPFNRGIDFTGGQALALQVKQPFPADGQTLAKIVEKYSEGEPTVQVDATDAHKASLRLRVQASGADTAELQANRAENVMAMKQEIGDAFGGYSADAAAANPLVLSDEFVGPAVGQELINKAIWALFWGSLLIFLYIWVRFLRWQMSISAIIGILHDVLITLAVTAILRLEVNSSFIAVLLTVMGYSINDKVIVFDRVRENLRSFGEKADFTQLCNLSISQTFTRTINTILNVVLMILALLLLGGGNVREFLIAMLVGMISAAYSSVYIAIPVMIGLSRGRMSAAEPVLVSVAAVPDVSGAGLPAESETLVTKAVKQEAERRKEKAAGKQQRRR